MHKRIYLSDFVEAFNEHGRDNQFSPAALEALFEFFEELEDETGGTRGAGRYRYLLLFYGIR